MIPEQTHGLEMAYRRMDPTADCGIQVFGEDLKALFENAGLALFDLIADISIVKSGVEHPIKVSGSYGQLVARTSLFLDSKGTTGKGNRGDRDY